MKQTKSKDFESFRKHRRLWPILNQGGFTVVEIIVSLFVVTILLGAATTVVSTATSVNRQTSDGADASALAFQKLQDYVNTDYQNIPIGLVGSSYEVEDFSTDTGVEELDNATAKVYISPASVVGGDVTNSTTVSMSETSTADVSASGGSEIVPTGDTDPGDCCSRDSRLRNGGYYDLLYNNRDSGSANQELVAIDLGSPQAVDTIRINWYTCNYISTNFRIEATNDASGTWTTVASGLSTQATVDCGLGNYPDNFAVSGTYRYWRMFNITGVSSTYIAISEFEAFSSGSGDVAEEDSTGALDTSGAELELPEDDSGNDQLVGVRFKDVTIDQSETIDNAYIQFTAAETDTDDTTIEIQGVDEASAGGWSGPSAITNGVAGANGTTATVSWTPGSWTAGDTEEVQRAPVTSIVQEIVNRGDWASDNNMAFVFTQGSSGGGGGPTIDGLSASTAFTSLGHANNGGSAGIRYFDLGGTTFSTYVDANGYVQVARDFGDGTGNLPQSTSLDSSNRGILSTAALTSLSDLDEVRMSDSTGVVDATTTDSTILSRVQSNTTLMQGPADNSINSSWSGTNAGYLNVSSTCSTPNGSSLHQNVFHPCGDGGGFHWMPSNNTQRRVWSGTGGGEIASSESLIMWVRAASVTIPSGGGGTGRRVAERTPEPQLVIEWSETTTTTTAGTYVDDDMDGDADNPTLLKVRVVVEYDIFGQRRTVEYASFIRQFGIGS